ncbi:2OG-Fe(II) oxygenase, partial [Paraburkholderia sp. RL17-381-BIF-C]
MDTIAKGQQSHSLELEFGAGAIQKPDLKDGEAQTAGSLAQRIGSVDWFEIEEGLNAYGCAMLRNLLSAGECDALTALYPREALFRSRVVMARHGFGRGEYKYFAYPLPPLIADLRTALYPCLAPVANRWNEVMGIDVRYPATHAEFIERCH